MSSLKDKDITAFAKLVYEYCKKVPKGKVTTYGDLAKAIGKPRAFRAVGHALSKNPYAPFVPCHRVVTGKRELGGFEGSTNLLGKNLSKKRKMLEDEGVVFDESVSEEKKSKVQYEKQSERIQ